MYSGSDNYAQNAHKKYSGVRRATAVIAALFTLVNTSAVTAAEEITISNSTQAAPSFNLNYYPAPADTAIAGKYIVVLKDNVVFEQAAAIAGGPSVMSNPMMAMQFKQMTVSTMAESLASNYDAQIEHTYFATISGFSMKMDQKKMLAMLADPLVDFIEQDQTRSISAIQPNATWGLDRIDEPTLPLDGSYNDFGNDGSGVTAYIVDTGIRTSHQQFAGRTAPGFTAINDGNGTDDCNGHGTHVAGTVGGSIHGVAKNVTLVPVRVLGCNGSGSNSGVINGIDWVAQNASGPSVANMSLGGGASSATDQAVENAVNSGVTFVVAAGNENRNACLGSPAREETAITVGSTTSSDGRSSFSNFGTCVDIFAPGSSITSAWHTSNSATNTISGTSMASPHVAGVAALYLDAFPNATPFQVAAALIEAAQPNVLSNVGSGSPNLLLQNDFDGGPVPTITPTPTPTATPDPGDLVLQNGVPVTGLSLTSGDDVVYTMNVPAGAEDISFSISGGTGDADLYVRFGAEPTDSTYDCRPYIDGNNETCAGSQSGGTYFVRVKAYSSFSGVTLVGSYESTGPTPTPTPTTTPTPTPPPGPTPIDEVVENVGGSWFSWTRYTLELPQGYNNLTVSISGGSGDADLYVNFGSQSGFFDYDCRPYQQGNNETCQFSNPSAGTWHIDLYGYRSFSGVTVRVQAN